MTIGSTRFRDGGARRARESGMSMVEVMIVMAIVGLIALVGLPRLEAWFERYKVRGMAEEIAVNLQLQRMRAVSRNQEFSIQFDATDGNFRLYEGTPGSWTAMEAAVHDLPTGVTFGTSDASDPIDLSFSGTEDVAVFHPDGTMNDRLAQDDAITIRNTLGDTFVVTVNRATGQVEVTEQ